MFISKTCDNFQTIDINLRTSIAVVCDVVDDFGLRRRYRNVCGEN